jgi:DNA polymerase III sliding clamp (beta) subunit (PCNA family)
MLIRWKGDDGTLRIKDGNLDRENMRIVLNVDRVAESEPQTETSPPIEIQPELTGKYRYRFNVQELQKRLRQLSAVVAQKAQEPTYFNVRLSSDAAGAVTLRGIDLDTTLTVKLAAASADGASSILLDYKKLNSIVQSFKTKEAYISFDDEKSVSIAAGSYKSTVRGSTCEVFEQLSVVQAITNNPEIGGYTVGLPELKEQIEQVSFSIPKVDGTRTVSCALLDCTPDTLRLVATDGQMIAISSIPANLGEFAFTLPKRLTALLSEMNGPTVTINPDRDYFYVQTERELLTYAMTHSGFPPYQKVLPKDTYPTTAILNDKAAVLAALDSIMPLCNSEEPRVKFVVSESDGIRLLAERASETGECQMAAAVDGPAVTFELNIARLLPFLKRAVFPLSIFALDDRHCIDFHANGGYRFLLMPMKTVVAEQVADGVAA